MTEHLLPFIQSLGVRLYYILFLISFLESTAFTGIIVPGETLVVIAGFMAHQGYIGLLPLLIWVGAGTILSYPCGYLLGRYLGADYYRRHRRILFLRERHFDRVYQVFARHGGKTIIFSRLFGFLRALAPFAAGMAQMPFGRFLAFSLAGGVVWTLVFVLLGYFLGESWALAEKWMGRAGLFLLFLALAVAFFLWLYRRLVKEQDRIFAFFREWGDTLRGRFPALFRFIEERLSPRAVLGLHLTLGFLLTAALAAVFAILAANLVPDRPLEELDRIILQYVLVFRHAWVDAFMLTLTGLGSAPFFSLASLVVGAFLLGRKRYDYLVTFLSALVGGSALVFIFKQAIGRVRPDVTTLIGPAYEFSFPSGHAMMSILFYGMAVYFAVRESRSWRLGVSLFLAAGFLVTLIGLSRIYLHAQYFSDVLAGFTGGLLWLTICLTGLEIYQRQAEAGRPVTPSFPPPPGNV